MPDPSCLMGPARYVTAVILTFTVGLVLAWSPVGQRIDWGVYDILLRANPPASEGSESVILAIDEESLEAVGGILKVRESLARALHILAQYDPASVAVDIVLAEPRTPQEDRALEQGLAATANLVLAASLRPSGDGWEQPIERFKRHAQSLAHVHAEPDTDAVCRRVLLAKASARTRLWAMGVEAYRAANGLGRIVESEDEVRIGDVSIPSSLRTDRELLVRYLGQSGSIERLSLGRLLEEPASAAAVRGRAVFIGVVALGGLDRYLMTPYSDGSPMAGVEINASVYETLARRAFLRPVSATWAFLTVALGAVAIGLSFRRLSGWNAVAAAAAVLLVLGGLPWICFRQDLVFPGAQALLPGWLCFLTAGAHHYVGVRGRLQQAEEQRSRYQKAVHFVTHEMRTPLTAIQGSSELISRYNLPEAKQREMGELIHRESQRLARMVEMFLSVERLSTGQLELKRERIDVDALLADCVDRIRPLAVRKRIEIDVGQSQAELMADREFLDYACYNLLSNAVKYSPSETAISVRAVKQNDSVLISVEDQGYGMDDSDLRSIFKKFYRTKSAQQSDERGSGLGLALVEEIVVQHAGSIEVTSEVGRGSKFTLKLPITRQVSK